jgi:hypothetical protein
MEDLILSLPILAATAALVIGIFWFSRRAKKKQESRLRELAAGHNWGFQPIRERLNWGFRLHTAQWEYEAISRSTDGPVAEGSINVAHNTQWQSARRPLPEGLVILSARKPNSGMGSLAAPWMQPALRQMLGDQADLVAGLQEAQVGSLALRERYSILAHHAADAENLLDLPVQQALLNWPGKQLPALQQSPLGLKIVFPGQRIEDPAEILSIIHLGETLISGEEK